MLFVKTSELKEGMRLARPIYNKNGVLLYERNSKLTGQGISSVKNFGLIGIFILEPAEPVPPMTKDDIEFERFQTMSVFAIKEEMAKILQSGHASRLQSIAGTIIKQYGHLDKKINLIQSLRSKEDFIQKHALNVAILCAMMTHVLNMRLDEQQDTVIAGLVHDIGKLKMSMSMPEDSEWDESDQEMMMRAQVEGFALIERAFASQGLRRICMQAQKLHEAFLKGKQIDAKLVQGAKVLAVANAFDEMTAMKFGGEPASEVHALKVLLENPDIFDEQVVDSLIRSIYILASGTSIELNTGEKGVVIRQNEENILRPMILTFHDNNIVDLRNEVLYGDLEIKDIMKTLDNRYIMNTGLLKENGIEVEAPEYVSVAGEETEEYVPGRDF